MKPISEEEKRALHDKLFPPVETHGPIGDLIFKSRTLDALGSLPPELIASWDRHFKGQYNREFGFPYRLKQGSPSKRQHVFAELVEHMKKGDPCFATARHYLGEGLPMILVDGKTRTDSSRLSLDRIFLDFDNKENPELALREAAKVYDVLSAVLECVPAINFSGSKGCHILIDADREPKIELNEALRRGVLVEFTERYIDALKVSYDREVAIDLNRLERISNTRHQKSGLWCIPLSREELDLPLETIRELAREPRLRGLPETRASPLLAGVLEQIAEQAKASAEALATANRLMEEMGLKKPRATIRPYRPVTGGGKKHCPGIDGALAGVDTSEHSRHLAAFGLQAFWRYIDEYSPEKLIEWNKLNTPPLSEEQMNAVLVRNVEGSFCTFLNKAGLCPSKCEVLQ